MAAELEVLDSPRYLAGTLGDLEITLYRDGAVTDPTGPITVTVKDEDGTTLSTGAATIVGGTTGQLRYTPTAAVMASVNRLTITWAGVVFGAEPAITVTSYAEVVGDMLFTEAQARAFDNGALSNTSTYPDDEIRRGHDRITDAFESILCYPLGRRYFRETIDGEGLTSLMLTRKYVRSVRQVYARAYGTTTWTAVTAAELADIYVLSTGAIVRESLGVFGRGTQLWRVAYEAGKPIHPELRRAGLILLRNQLVPSNVSDRALFETTSQGQFRMATANPDRGFHYGIPQVDAALQRHQEPVLVW